MTSLASGARLSISGPDNHFALTPGAHERLLIAGGISVTPIVSHAAALARAGVKVRALYGESRRLCVCPAARRCARRPAQIIRSCRGAGDRLRRRIFSVVARSGDLCLRPDRHAGSRQGAWAAAGRPRERLRFETFGATSGAWPTKAFRVKIPRLGKDILVAETQDLLEALETAGVEMLSDCRRGECGLCALPIESAEGIVDHRDVFFSDAEKASNAKLCCCVSRVYGESITLDTADR